MCHSKVPLPTKTLAAGPWCQLRASAAEGGPIPLGPWLEASPQLYPEDADRADSYPWELLSAVAPVLDPYVSHSPAASQPCLSRDPAEPGASAGSHPGLAAGRTHVGAVLVAPHPALHPAGMGPGCAQGSQAATGPYRSHANPKS